jgi:hypothetical protein
MCDRSQESILFRPREYMTDDQVNAAQGFSLTMIIISSTLAGWFFLFESHYSLKNLIFGINESDGAGKANDNRYTTVDEVEAYVPQIRDDGLETPLLACNLGLFDPEYIDWQGKYANYDLYADSEKILQDLGFTGDASLDINTIFSTCKVYPTEANPDPLHKIDDGDHGFGAMWVGVERCENLIVGDAFSMSSDPKVKVIFDGMKWKTITVQNSLEPVFGEDFRVPVMEVPVKGSADSELVLVVTDEDDYLGLTYDFLGTVKLDMGSLIDECLVSQATGVKKLVKTLALLDKNFSMSFVDLSGMQNDAGDLDVIPQQKPVARNKSACVRRTEGQYGESMNSEAPRGTIELHFLWQPHCIGEAASATEHAIRMGMPIEFTAVDPSASELGCQETAGASEAEQVGSAGHDHGRKRSSAGYLQDLTPEQLAAVVATEAGSGMRIMV